jgi:hypothetical protein
MEAKPNGTKHHIGRNGAGSGVSAWWELNRRSFGPGKALLILVVITPLLVWQPDSKVSWYLFSFGTTFVAQRFLVSYGFPSDALLKLLMILAAVQFVLGLVLLVAHPTDGRLLMCGFGVLAAAWAAREQDRRERAMR